MTLGYNDSIKSVNVSTIQYSPDGINWHSANYGGFIKGYGVAYGNDMWVGVGARGAAPLGTIQYSYDGLYWSTIVTGGFSDQGYKVAYGNGLWVAVGKTDDTPVSTIQYSSNGISWYEVNYPGFIRGYGIAYGNNLWVAVGQAGGSALSTIQYSSDGSNWSTIVTGGFNTYGKGVTYGNGMWVAVGDGASIHSTIQYSPDGSNWSNVDSGGFNYNGVGVAYGSSLWVAVGSADSPVNSIQWSSDAITWSNAYSVDFTGSNQNGVTYNNGLWVVVGISDVDNGDGSYTNTVKYSTDGSNWTSVPINTLSSGNDITSGYIQQMILYSTITYTAPVIDIGSNISISILNSNLTISNPSNPLYITNDLYAKNLETTHIQLDPQQRYSTLRYSSIISYSRLFVAVGDNYETTNISSIQYSSDGCNWYGANYGGFDTIGRGVAYGNNLWVAVGDSGYTGSTIQYSSDGSNWSNIDTGGFYGSGIGVAYGNGLWMAVGTYSESALSTIQYSRNGSNWSNIATGGFNGAGFGVAYGSSLWVAVGSGDGSILSTIQYSSNGCNWSNIDTGGFNGVGIGLAYGNGVWVAVGGGLVPDPFSTIQYSSDGSNWSNIDSGGFLNSGSGVAYGSSLWVAVGGTDSPENSIQWSSNGINWSNAYSVDFSSIYQNGVTYNNGLWVVVGSNDSPSSNIIKYSSDGSNWFSVSTNALYIGNGVGSRNIPYTTMGSTLSYISPVIDIGSNINISLVDSDLTISNPSNPVYITNDLYAKNLETTHIQLDPQTYSTLSYSSTVSYSNFFVAVGIPASGNSLSTIQYSSNGSDWYGANYGVFDAPFFGVAYGSNLWVAVGGTLNTYLQTIQYSSDGCNWSTITTGGFAEQGRGVAYGNGLWVAVGKDEENLNLKTIQYSSNGSDWYQANYGGFNVISVYGNIGYGVAYGNGLWVAVGGGTSPINTIQYSPNGSNWSTIVTGGFNTYGRGVAYGNGVWVAVGGGFVPGPFSTIQYSSDGSNWSNADSGGFLDSGRGVAYGSSLWVAVGGTDSPENSIQWSSNGINWSNAYSVDFSSIYQNGVTYNNGLWVVVGSNDSPSSNVTKYSSDGSNWTSVSTNALYIGNGVGSRNIPYTTMGSTLTYTAPLIDIGPNTSISLVNSNFTITTSSISLEFTPGLISRLNNINNASNSSSNTTTNSIVTSTIQAKNILTSTITIGSSNIDGKHTIIADNYVLAQNMFTSTIDIIYMKGITIDTTDIFTTNISASTINASNITTSNITTSNITTSNITTSNLLTSNIITSNIFTRNISTTNISTTNIIASSIFTNVMNTTDIRLTERFLSNAITSTVIYTYVAVGQGSFANNTILWSFDHFTWSNANSGGFSVNSNTGLSVAYGNNMFVAVGASSTKNNTIQYSYDGSNWSNVNGSTAATGGFGGDNMYGRGVAYANGVWVAVGGRDSDLGSTGMEGTVRYSTDGINWINGAGIGFAVFGAGANGVAYGTGYRVGGAAVNMWILVGNRGPYDSASHSFSVSLDGYNWTTAITGGEFSGAGFCNFKGNDIFYANNLWVAVGEGNDPLNSILWSSNGFLWNNATSGGFTGGTGTGITYGNGYWVAVGLNADSSKGVKFSSDGSNWTQSQTIPNANQINSIRFTNGSFYVTNSNNFPYDTIVRFDNPTNGSQYSSVDDSNGDYFASNVAYGVASGYIPTYYSNARYGADITFGSNYSISVRDNNIRFISQSNSIALNSTLISSLNTLVSGSSGGGGGGGLLGITYVSTAGVTVTPPSGTTYVRITNMAGGGVGGSLYATSAYGGGGGGGGGTIIYTTLLSNFNISYNRLSTIGINNYSTCCVFLSSQTTTLNLYAFYGKNANGSNGGFGGNAYGPKGSIVVVGMNGYSGGNSQNNYNGYGPLGGSIYFMDDTNYAGGGMGGGPEGGAGGYNSGGFPGGFGSGGGGGTADGFGGGAGGPPLITFEWL